MTRLGETTREDRARLYQPLLTGACVLAMLAIYAWCLLGGGGS